MRRPIADYRASAGCAWLKRWRGGLGVCGRILACVGIALVVEACSTRQPAPVESREAGSPPAEDRRSDVHRVASGDTLYSIAWKAGLDYRRVAAWNGIESPYTIYPGQELSLRGPASKPVVKAEAPKVERPEPAKPASRPAAPDSRPDPSATRSAASEEARADARLDARTGLRWSWPTAGRLAQGFVPNDRTRQGIKITGTMGQSVLAAERGRVVYSGSGLIGYGQLVIIKHNQHYLSAYGHNRAILVREGDRVERGERIGEMGRSADGAATLHFEIRRDGTPVNPLHLLPKQG